MALTESQIKVIIAAELQKGGFDKAERATKNLTKSFKTLGATIGVALSARAFINFAKQGAIAFANEEKAVKQLTNSLGNLGFAFSVPAVERYIDNVEKATMVSKDELRPAMVQLISSTMSAQKSMDLLGTALDIAAETGASVSQVTTALSRAYNGNYTSLAKLSRGYTSAQLEAAGFDLTVQMLNDRFTGSAAAASDSYSFKIAQLQKAFKDAQKEVGSGLIKGIEQLGSGDYDEGLQDLVDFGTAIGKSFGYAAGAVNTLKEAYDIITLRFVRDKTLQALGKIQTPEQRGGTITPTQRELAIAAVQRRQEKALRDAERRDREKLRKLSEKERKAREAALKKEQQLKRAGSVFDMENIQIVAAMQNRLTEEQRIRLIALLAINNDMADVADKTTQAILLMQKPALEALGITLQAGDNATDVINKILQAQTKIFLLNTGIATIPKAKNPFEDWDAILDRLMAKISAMAGMINNFGKTTLTPVPPTTIITPGTTTSGSGDTTENGTRTVRVSKYVDTGTCPSGEAFYDDTYVNGQLVSSTFVSCVILTNIVGTPGGDGSMTISTGTGDVTMGQGTFQVGGANIISGFGTPMTANPFDDPNEVAARQRIADVFATIGTFGAGGLPTTNVIVNVAGSVTTEGDLTQNILDGLYEYQRRGQSITVSAVGL